MPGQDCNSGEDCSSGRNRLAGGTTSGTAARPSRDRGWSPERSTGRVTAPDPLTYVVEANAADVETPFEIYLDVLAAGGADPAGGEAARDVFVEGWIRRRRGTLRRDGATLGGYFLRSNFPAMAGHIAQAGYLVAQSERGRGIGTRLLAHSLEEAAPHGYRAMMFNLVQESNPSRRLYEGAGFRVIGRVPQVHGEETGLYNAPFSCSDGTAVLGRSEQDLRGAIRGTGIGS